MCVKCVSASCEDGLFAHLDPMSHLTTPPLPLSGATLEHRCTFCRECQWTVSEREVDGKEFVEQMSEKCGREESLSQHDEVKRLWNQWEDDSGEQKLQNVRNFCRYFVLLIFSVSDVTVRRLISNKSNHTHDSKRVFSTNTSFCSQNEKTKNGFLRYNRHEIIIQLYYKFAVSVFFVS